VCCRRGVAGTDTGNLTSHARTDSHVRAWRAHEARAAGDIRASLVEKRLVLVGQALVAAKALEVDLRSLVTGACVAKGACPNLLVAMFGKDSPVPSALETLRVHKVSAFGSSTMTRSGVERADELMCERIKHELKGTTGALVVDGATFKHLKAIGICFVSAWLKEPVFLALVFASVDAFGKSTYDNVACTRDITKAMVEFGLTIDQITCLMGDNVSFNACIARNLGVALGKCIPHALALTVKKALLNLPCSKDIVVYGSSILHAGGTTQRAAALDLLGAQAKYLSARFCSAVAPAEYRLENWEVLADFYTSSETLPLRTGIGRRDERADL